MLCWANAKWKKKWIFVQLFVFLCETVVSQTPQMTKNPSSTPCLSPVSTWSSRSLESWSSPDTTIAFVPIWAKWTAPSERLKLERVGRQTLLLPHTTHKSLDFPGRVLLLFSGFSSTPRNWVFTRLLLLNSRVCFFFFSPHFLLHGSRGWTGGGCETVNAKQIWVGFWKKRGLAKCKCCWLID